MKRWFFWSFVSVVTFSVGVILIYALVTLTTRTLTAENLVEKVAQEPPLAPVRLDNQIVAEFTDLPDYEMLDFPELPANFIDLHNSGGLLRRSEVVGKTGQNWLVMSEKQGRYTVTAATAKVRNLATVSYPGDENDAKISFAVSGKPVFAFRGIANIRAGSVTTVYLRPTWDEIERRNLPIDPMETGFKRELNLNENWYTLRVSHGVTKSGEKAGVLVLEKDGMKRVIARNYYEVPHGTTIGDLLWAGDLDNDGRLDLYFDEYNEKGYFNGGLYLSSHAEEGEFLKLGGSFSYAGC